MIKSVLAAVALTISAIGVQAASLSQVSVDPSAPVIDGNATNMPFPPLVYPGFEVDFTGVGFLSTDPTFAPLDIRIETSFFGPEVPLKVTDPTNGDSLVLSGLKIDSAQSGDTVTLLYNNLMGSAASAFGSLFRVTITDGNFAGADFTNTVIGADAFIKIEGVTMSVIPLPASLPFLAFSLGAFGVMRRRGLWIK